MSEKPAPLWLHIYSGREHGLMVVGDSASLKALANQLLASTGAASPPIEGGWPQSVATPEIVGPYKNDSHFKLSFHLQGSAPLQKILPLRRVGLPLPLLIAVAVCAAVGAVVILGWAVAFAL